MKKSTLAILFFLALGIPKSLAITLKEAESLTVKNHPSLKALNYLEKSIKTKRKAIERERFGSVQLFGGLSHSNKNYMLVPMSSLPSKNSPPPFDQDIGFYGIEYTLPIYQGGRISKTAELLKIKLNQLKETKGSVKDKLIFQTDTTYITYLAVKEEEKAFRNYLKSLKKLKEDVEAGIKAGKFAKVDLLKVEYEIAKVEKALISFRNQEKALLEILSNLTGRKVKEIKPIKLKRHEIGSYEALIKKAEESHFIKAKLFEVKSGEEKVKLTKSKFNPKVSIKALYKRNYGFDSHENEPFGSLEVKVSFPIFTAGRKSLEILSSKLEKLSKEKEKKAAEIKLKNEIANAIAEYKSNESLIEALKREVELAKETERIENLKYQSGKGCIEHLLLAEGKLFVAKAKLKSAIYRREILFRKIKTLVKSGEIR